EPHLLVERDPSAGSDKAGDRAQNRRLARAGRADERDGPADRERDPQLEVAKRKRNVESEGRHLIVMRSAALTRMRSALTASATVRSWSNSEYTASGRVWVRP